ncbi:leucine--tRNA ligase, cytoplasmic-like [Senna tora]|uniref:Leucine--tRNA ligase, cytoplasmic-like n=1 Tax=Senna tora TaxID=362788 RepID=A0A834W5F9_9FABA|nr:leucine--tRNA ligase, cytoplasmic-like [Senna tora]
MLARKLEAQLDEQINAYGMKLNTAKTVSFALSQKWMWWKLERLKSKKLHHQRLPHQKKMTAEPRFWFKHKQKKMTAFLYSGLSYHQLATESGKSFARRNHLREIKVKVRQWWNEKDVFKAGPCEKPPEAGEKLFGNFPFPYMNGYLHLGHAFPLSKLEFAANYHRLRDANVILPFAFHCTGIYELPKNEDNSGGATPDKFKGKKVQGQPFADYDRASGEGVQLLKYTIIKMEVLQPFLAKFAVLEGIKVYLAVATLRPKTMYGQTNAWVLPDRKYGAFETT